MKSYLSGTWRGRARICVVFRFKRSVLNIFQLFLCNTTYCQLLCKKCFAGANNVLPEECVPHIIIDHHSSDKPVSADVAFLRPEYSATSSLISNLLMNMSVDMTPRLATALSFGIRTDTLSFTRSFNPVDLRALMWLNTWVDSELLTSIEAPLKNQYTLETFTQALTNKEHEATQESNSENGKCQHAQKS